MLVGGGAWVLGEAAAAAARARVYIRRHCDGPGRARPHLICVNGPAQLDVAEWAHVPEEELVKRHAVQCMVCEMHFSIAKQ